MFVDTINQLSDRGLRRVCDFNVRLIPRKSEKYIETKTKVQLLESVNVKLELCFERYDGKTCLIPLFKALPQEWEPTRLQRLSRDEFKHLQRAMTWMARTTADEIGRQVNRLGQLTLRGKRVQQKFDSREFAELELQLPIYICTGMIDLTSSTATPPNCPPGMFWQVR